ncbi:hypothetical protein Tco_0386866 [Tanacetum coccineum]
MLEPIKVKCIFVGYREGDHTFKVEPQGNVGQVAGSQKVQTQNFFGYQSARDREQHSTQELFRYREDSNEAAFVVAEAEKIYAHESLTFNDTIACEVNSNWKTGLKEEMDARSDAYVLSNGCRKCGDDRNDYFWEYATAKRNVLGMEIFRDRSGNTLSVSQSRFYNGKLVKTLLEGHYILSLEGSLSGDSNVEKNGWEAKLHHKWALSTTEAEYVTLRETVKEAIWLKGLLAKS